MQQVLLDHLRKITEEEQRILDGVAEVDKDLYTSGKDFTVDSAKMLSEGKLSAVRTHTRFVHFPSHRHNFIEVLYVCQGRLVNIIGGKEVVIQKGELLFLNQFTRHEILPAGEEDIAINFMILPEFFDVAYTMAGNNNVLADFLVNVLRQDEERGEYLHFKELLQRKRLNKAEELMCETDLPVSDVIAAVGYENGSYFHRVFKEHYHMTPRAFRIANSKEERIRL